MFKVGDRVWSTSYGWGKVEYISEKNYTHPVVVKFTDKYGDEFEINHSMDGKFYQYDIFPSLFFKEIPKEVIKEYQERPRWRAKEGNIYYFVGSDGLIHSIEDVRDISNNKMFKVGNYFKNTEEAEESKIYKAFHGEE